MKTLVHARWTVIVSGSWQRHCVQASSWIVPSLCRTTPPQRTRLSMSDAFVSKSNVFQSLSSKRPAKQAEVWWSWTNWTMKPRSAHNDRWISPCRLLHVLHFSKQSDEVFANESGIGEIKIMEETTTSLVLVVSKPEDWLRDAWNRSNFQDSRTTSNLNWKS